MATQKFEIDPKSNFEIDPNIFFSKKWPKQFFFRQQIEFCTQTNIFQKKIFAWKVKNAQNSYFLYVMFMYALIIDWSVKNSNFQKNNRWKFLPNF